MIVRASRPISSCQVSGSVSISRLVASQLRLVPPSTVAVSPAHDSLFLRSCRREPVPRPPVWLMRQAGRYLPEYQAIRNKVTFLELCKSPALSAEVMLATVDRLQVDAAIIFSDLLPLLEPMGMQLTFAEGEGPVIHNPIRSSDDLPRFQELEDVSPLDFVYETVRASRPISSCQVSGSVSISRLVASQLRLV
ncbi:MAG: hypothetical protein EBZ13_10770, partial [Planctomycetia bacterium]|nr:hypothetical protein [Planctomycetia bacterium]